MGNQIVVQVAVNDVRRHCAMLRAVVERPELTVSGPALDKAIARYKNFMYLRAEGVASNAPLDVEWIWHVHRLHPLAYIRDCNKAFSKVIPSQQTAVMSKWSVRKAVWEELKEFDKQYDFVKESPPVSIEKAIAKFAPSIDLVAAVGRQATFTAHVKEFSVFTAEDIKAYIRRYKKFLYLIKRQGQHNVIVPTLGIDLIWHTHMRLPEHYELDTKLILGKTLDHNDDIADEKLTEFVDTTKILWKHEFKTNYFSPPTRKKKDPRANRIFDYKDDGLWNVTFFTEYGVSSHFASACGPSVPENAPSRGYKQYHHSHRHHHNAHSRSHGISSTSSCGGSSDNSSCGGTTASSCGGAISSCGGGTTASSCGGATSSCGGGTSSCGGGTSSCGGGGSSCGSSCGGS